jgi:hypothetical protein
VLREFHLYKKLIFFLYLLKNIVMPSKILMWQLIKGVCRQNLVGSLPRGMPKVVDCRQTGVQATNEMVMQNRVGVIPYVLLCFVIAVSNNVLQARLPYSVFQCFLRGPLPSLYCLGGRVTDLKTNLSWLRLARLLEVSSSATADTNPTTHNLRTCQNCSSKFVRCTCSAFRREMNW